MPRYQVFDNNVPAEYVMKGSGYHLTNSIHETLEAAQEYVKDWIGRWDVGELKPGARMDYTGNGDFIEIREISAPQE